MENCKFIFPFAYIEKEYDCNLYYLIVSVESLCWTIYSIMLSPTFVYKTLVVGQWMNTLQIRAVPMK